MRPSLTQALRQLRLSGLLSSLEVRLAEAAGNRLDHGEFLELILQDELAVRASRQVERRTKAALFRECKPLDEFNFDFNSSIKRKQIHDLASGKFIRDIPTLLPATYDQWRNDLAGLIEQLLDHGHADLRARLGQVLGDLLVGQVGPADLLPHRVARRAVLEDPQEVLLQVRDGAYAVLASAPFLRLFCKACG